MDVMDGQRSSRGDEGGADEWRRKNEGSSRRYQLTSTKY